MDYISLIGIAAGLSMDAFAVSITNGAVTKKVSAWLAFKVGLAFGLFQAFMPFIGWLIGTVGAEFISSIDHWIALILLGYLGIQMIVESRKKDDDGNCEQTDIPLRRLLSLAVATSIDALATGVILPSAVGASTVGLMLLSVGTIGVITFCFSFAGVYIGKKFGSLLSSKAEIVGGIVLVAIGVRIFADHMFFS